MVLSGHSIRRLRPRPFEPFEPESKRAFGRSYGVSHAGYDVRVAESILLWPKGFTLASTIERFTMPWDCLAGIHDKSTNIRVGLAVQNSTAEPNWTGHLTIELENKTWRFIRVHAGTPIAAIVFERIEYPLDVRLLKLVWRVIGRHLGMRDPAPGYTGGKYDKQPAHAVPAIMEP